MVEARPILSPTSSRVMGTDEYLEALKTTRLHGWEGALAKLPRKRGASLSQGGAPLLG
jgi:hypothetical protein